MNGQMTTRKDINHALCIPVVSCSTCYSYRKAHYAGGQEGQQTTVRERERERGAQSRRAAPCVLPYTRLLSGAPGGRPSPSCMSGSAVCCWPLASCLLLSTVLRVNCSRGCRALLLRLRRLRSLSLVCARERGGARQQSWRPLSARERDSRESVNLLNYVEFYGTSL
jgi:hypothetical protein